MLRDLIVLADNDTEAQGPPLYYSERDVRWLVDLDAEGEFLSVVDTAEPQSKAAKFGQRRIVPIANRTSTQIKPAPFVDTAAYTLGVPDPEKTGKKEAHDRAKHPAFISLMREVAESTGHPAARAVVAFLDDGGALRIRTEHPNISVKHNVAFQVNNVRPELDPAIQEDWARRRAEPDAPVMACMLCGQMRLMQRLHPIPIKGIPSNPPLRGGARLVSANSPAYWSWGLEQSMIAPMCERCSQGYANALNRLLAEEESSLRVGEVAYVFWTDGAAWSPAVILSNPRPAMLRELFASPVEARPGALNLDERRFVAVALSLTKSRVVVRSALETTVGAAKTRLRHYFSLQGVVDVNGADGAPLPIWRLANATRSPAEAEKGHAPRKTIARDLLDLALTGGRQVAGSLLSAAVERCRAERDVSRERAVLLMIALGTISEWDEERITRMRSLDEGNEDAAYLCGRLLAVLDAIQYRALADEGRMPNRTMVDAYYGGASGTPQFIFPVLLRQSRHHLAKMRRDPRKEIAARAEERRLTLLVSQIDQFPVMLNLKRQGMFALGFYHQKAADMAHREAAKAAKRDSGNAGDGQDLADGGEAAVQERMGDQ